MTDLLLDTCAAIWIVSDADLRRGTKEAIARVIAAGGSLFVSPISAWKVGMLVSRGHLSLPFPPLEWYERLISLPNYATIDLSARILADSHFLPGTPPGDPMDRIMIATARTHGLRIMTRDARILDYADKGHVLALAC